MDNGVLEVDGIMKTGMDDEDGFTPRENRLRKQNQCFVSVMVVALVGALYFINTLYPSGDYVDGYQGSGTQELPQGMDPQLVAEGVTQLPPHNPVKHHQKNKQSGNNNNNNPTIEEWLHAKVTIQDGIKYEVVDRLVHDRRSFTEGLTYANGKLYESIGLYHQSALLELNPSTGHIVSTTAMPGSEFGEGLTYFDNKFIQLTYKMKKGYIYNANDLTQPPKVFKFDTTTHEGWGLTYDPDRDELIVSDGSEYLHIWDPVTLEEKRKVSVTLLNGRKAHDVNELEYWRGRVLANVWHHDNLLVIHPETGVVEKEYDFSTLWQKSERRRAGADVLNGISVSEEEDILYMTGKNWDRMFKIRLLY